MNWAIAAAGIVWLTTGCATQLAEKGVNDTCAAEGKKAFILEMKHAGIPLVIESANVSSVCFGPTDTVYLPANFGADAISFANLHGTGIVAVQPGLVADKAGLRVNDIVTTFADQPVPLASDLRSAILRVGPGAHAAIKVRRNGKELVFTASF